MNRIYMDNAATTRVTQPVLEAMMPGRPIEVTTIETVLRGGEKCRFLVTVGPVPR